MALFFFHVDLFDPTIGELVEDGFVINISYWSNGVEGDTWERIWLKSPDKMFNKQSEV